ncbi:MAG: hypothetical protein ACLFPN_01735 [Methanomassiliicoccales archaeon]
MVCIGCGTGTAEGSVLCGRCLRRIEDPLALLPRTLDPASDRRYWHTSSAVLSIGPVSSAEVSPAKGVETAVRLNHLREGDLPSLVERYLSFLGVPLHVWGREILPYREITWRLLRRCEAEDFSTLTWARACTRLGNLLSLLLRRLSTLPIEREPLERYMEELAGRARDLYSHADPFPRVRWVAVSNQALMEHWTGDQEKALELVDLARSRGREGDRELATVKRALILDEMGRTEESLECLRSLPNDFHHPVADRLWREAHEDP